jgi:hypothetical protein
VVAGAFVFLIRAQSRDHAQYGDINPRVAIIVLIALVAYG